MKNKHKLTNRDISNEYKNRKYFLMKSDFLGAFAYWVVSQSPYDTPDITPALKAFDEYLSLTFKDDEVKGFAHNKLEKFISPAIFVSIPEIEKLNHPKIDTGAKFTFVDRYSKPKADYDFIDLCALSKNIFYMICRTIITQP